MTKVMPLSFSRLSTFEQCPAQFDYLYVSKRVVNESNEHSDYGDRVHKVLEAKGKGTLDESTLTDEGRSTLERWGHIVDKIISIPGRNLTPVGWFDSDVWIRSIADVLVVDGATAYCLDYKTGKVKENPTQLQLFAAMVMWHFPEVQTVKTSFIWLKFDEVTNAKYERRFLDALWAALEPRFVKVQEVINLGVFNTRPSGLCPWCAAKDICPDARLKGRR